MKISLSAAVLVLSGLQAQANTAVSTYVAKTVLPLSLQVQILKELKARCPEAISEFGLTEVETELKTGSFEKRGYRFYTTTFRSHYYSDGMHPAWTRITVYSEERELENQSVELGVGRIVSDLCES